MQDRILQESITATLGVVNADGTAADCADVDTSVVCSLQRAQSQFTDAVDQVNASVDRAQAAATVLDPSTAGGSAAPLQQVSNCLAALVDGLLGDQASTDDGKALQDRVDVARLAAVEQALAAATDTTPADGQPSLASVDATLEQVTTALQGINYTATTNLTEVGGAVTQNGALATQLVRPRHVRSPDAGRGGPPARLPRHHAVRGADPAPGPPRRRADAPWRTASLPSRPRGARCATRRLPTARCCGA